MRYNRTTMTDDTKQLLDVLHKMMDNQNTINSRLIDIQETLKGIKKKVDAGIDNDIATGTDLAQIDKQIKELLNR